MNHKLPIPVWAAYLIVGFIALVQYSNTFNHDYAWDDAIVITENSRVQKGLSDVGELFENIKSDKVENRYGYRPISLLSFSTDVQIWGMRPGPAHVVNVILYSLLCTLVLYFVTYVFGNVWLGLFTALIFAVHPIHSEVVCNIKSRDEILAMLFGIIGILFYVKGLDRPWLFIGSMIAFLLSFLSKESGVVFPVIAVFTAWQKQKLATVSKWALAILPGVVGVVMLVVVRKYVYSESFFQTNDWDLIDRGVFLQEGFVGNPLSAVGSVTDKAANVLHLFGLYLLKFFWPYPLIHDYSFNHLKLVSWSDPAVWVSLVAFTLVSAISVLGLLRRWIFAYGLIFFGISLAIYLHIVQPAPDIFAERFLFVPSLGLSIAFVALVLWLSERYSTKLVYVFIPLATVFALSGFARNKAWKDNETLFRTDLENLKDCCRANYNYALLLHGKYYKAPPVESSRLKSDIIKYYETAYSINERLMPLLMDLGGAYMEFGYPDKAKGVFENAIKLYPDISPGYVQMGKYHMSFKEYESAVPYFEKAVEIGKTNSDFYYLLAVCKFNSGKQDEAIQDMLIGEQYGVSSSAYHYLLARFYRALANEPGAVGALDRGLRLYPNDQGLLEMRASLTSD